MTQRDPPVEHCVVSPLPAATATATSPDHPLLMQLAKIAIIAKDAPLPIKGDALSVVVVEDVEAGEVEREDGGDFLEEGGEGGKAGGVFRQEG